MHVPRRLGEEHDQSSQAYSWEDLKSKRNTPLGITVLQISVGTPGYPASDKGTHAQHELLESRNASSDTRMSQLCLVPARISQRSWVSIPSHLQGNNHRQESNTNTSEESARPEIAKIFSSGLE